MTQSINHKRLASTLKRHEGLRLDIYQCTAGANTIGYGHNLDAAFTEQHAQAMLDIDIDNAMRDVYTVPGLAAIESPVRREVLINMMFNLGMTRFMGFKNMLAAIRRKDWETAADEMLDSKWHRQVGQRARELAELMREG